MQDVVLRLNKEVCRTYKRLSYLHRMTEWEIMQTIRAIISSEVDPIAGEGELFEFRNNFPFLGHVPPPRARVNLLDALAHAREHAEECRAILANGPTLAELRMVTQNTVGWLRFWAVRDRTLELRKRAAEELAAWEERRIDNE